MAFSSVRQSGVRMLQAVFLFSVLATTALPAHAAKYYDEDYNSQMDQDCDQKQKDLVEDANTDHRMPKKVNDETGANDQLKNMTQQIGNFPSSINSMPFGMMSGGSGGMMNGLASAIGSFGGGGGNGQSNSQALVRQNKNSCKSKNRMAQVKNKAQQPGDGQTVDSPKY